MIKNRLSDITSELKNIFQQFHDVYAIKENNNILISHFGSFSQDLINSLSEGVEELMISVGDNTKIIKRVFSILIEGLQNIRFHGGRNVKGDQAAFLIVSKSEEVYKINLGNLIKTKEITGFQNHIDKINSLEPVELKKYYLETLTNGIMSQKNGAGLGFITMKLKSENPLKYDFTPFDQELSILSVEVTIDRII